MYLTIVQETICPRVVDPTVVLHNVVDPPTVVLTVVDLCVVHQDVVQHPTVVPLVVTQYRSPHLPREDKSPLKGSQTIAIS